MIFFANKCGCDASSLMPHGKRLQVLARHFDSAQNTHITSFPLSGDDHEDDENPWNVGEPQIWTRQMIADANEEGQAIIVIHGKVYDCTDFLPEHPGGGEVITDIDALDLAGMDEGFDEAEHSEESIDDMKLLYVGELASKEQEAAVRRGEDLPPPPSNAGTLKAIFQSIPDMADMYESDEDEEGEDSEDSDEGEEGYNDEEIEKALKEAGMEGGSGVFKTAKRVTLPLALAEKIIINHNTRLLRFVLPEDDAELGLPIGNHLSLSYNDENGTRVTRRYTPTSLGHTVGYVDLLVKVYFANEHPK